MGNKTSASAATPHVVKRFERPEDPNDPWPCEICLKTEQADKDWILCGWCQCRWYHLKCLEKEAKESLEPVDDPKTDRSWWCLSCRRCTKCQKEWVDGDENSYYSCAVCREMYHSACVPADNNCLHCASPLSRGDMPDQSPFSNDQEYKQSDPLDPVLEVDNENSSSRPATAASGLLGRPTPEPSEPPGEPWPCEVCGKADCALDDWVQCDWCNARWYHITCLPRDEMLRQIEVMRRGRGATLWCCFSCRQCEQCKQSFPSVPNPRHTVAECTSCFKFFHVQCAAEVCPLCGKRVIQLAQEDERQDEKKEKVKTEVKRKENPAYKHERRMKWKWGCTVCAGIFSREHDWVLCEFCESRWFHIDCLESEERSSLAPGQSGDKGFACCFCARCDKCQTKWTVKDKAPVSCPECNKYFHAKCTRQNNKCPDCRTTCEKTPSGLITALVAAISQKQPLVVDKEREKAREDRFKEEREREEGAMEKMQKEEKEREKKELGKKAKEASKKELEMHDKEREYEREERAKQKTEKKVSIVLPHGARAETMPQDEKDGASGAKKPPRSKQKSSNCQ